MAAYMFMFTSLFLVFAMAASADEKTAQRSKRDAVVINMNVMAEESGVDPAGYRPKSEDVQGFGHLQDL